MVGGIPQSLSVLPVLDLVELGKIQVQVYSPPAARGTSLVGCRLVLCGQHQLDEMPQRSPQCGSGSGSDKAGFRYCKLFFHLGLAQRKFRMDQSLHVTVRLRTLARNAIYVAKVMGKSTVLHRIDPNPEYHPDYDEKLFTELPQNIIEMDPLKWENHLMGRFKDETAVFNKVLSMVNSLGVRKEAHKIAQLRISLNSSFLMLK